MTPLSAAFALLALGQGSPSISNYTQEGLRDLKFTQKIVSGNQRELRKINNDFAQAYRFSTATVWLKEPFKLRMESTVDDTSIIFIVNGGRKVTKVPRSRIRVADDVSKAPGKRQTAFDFGLLPPSLFDGLFQAKFVRNDRATGDMVFDVTYVPSLKDTTRHRIWIDPDKHAMTKREWYGQDGRMMATFTLEGHTKVGSVWLPTKLTVRNSDNAVAGVTTYVNPQLNSGLGEDLFKLD